MLNLIYFTVLTTVVSFVNGIQGPQYVNLPCSDTPFCARHRAFETDLFEYGLEVGTDLYYTLDPQTIQINDAYGSISAVLNLATLDSGDLAQTLNLRMTFYQNGIMRALIGEPGNTRFRISETGLPVVEEQLFPVQNLSTLVQLLGQQLIVDNLNHEDGTETFKYVVNFDHFSVQQYSNGKLTLVMNPNDSLYYESDFKSTNHIHVYQSETHGFTGLKKRTEKRYGSNIFADWSDAYRGEIFGGVKSAVGMGFWYPSKTLFGIPERESGLILQDTTDDSPYQLFATDQPQHMPGNAQPLYGSVPYVQGVSDVSTESSLWVNSAHTWIEIKDMAYKQNDGKFASYVSESGGLELFMFASTTSGDSPYNGSRFNRFKKVQQDLAIVSGFVPLPQYHALGYHFCKWANVSADMIMERNKNFTEFGFPLDVLWMDIEWSDQYSDPSGYEYFIFNPQNFTEHKLSKMNEEVAASNRRLTVIVDPHIKAVDTFYVWEDGIVDEDQPEPTGNYTNIFVRHPKTNNVWFGDCWPGNSSWIDFLNENAQNYWGQQMLYSNFKGSSYLYTFWNDMNEPSVFSTSSKTLPMDTIHYKADGTKVEHRDFHNAYGGMQQRSSFRGLLARDNYTRRPFVLTRSFFLGSQKFGTYWTGDNRSIYQEVPGSMRMIMSLGISGVPFGGSDVPGFYGMPTEELWVMFYQMGAFYPFFRAHTHLDCPNREPWMQSQRVQTSIRATLNQRYDLIRYLYTTFKQTTVTAEPIMRPMWQDFPEDVKTYTMTTQFMWGDSFLVAPKITAPDAVMVQMQMQSVDYYLPKTEMWYSYDTKLVDKNVGVWNTVYLQDQQQAVFVKGGSIIPILLHENCMSLLSCINNPLRIEVYPDANGWAQGYIYLDDGESLAYEIEPKTSAALVQMTWSGNTLYLNNDTDYVFPLTQRVTQVAVYGIETSPALVTGGMYEVPFVYDKAMKAVFTSGFAFELNQGLTVNLVWN